MGYERWEVEIEYVTLKTGGQQSESELGGVMSEVGSGSSEIRMSQVGGRGARGWEIDGGSSDSRGQRSKVGGERWEEEGGRWEENQARALARV